MAIVQNNYWEPNEGKDMGNEEETQKNNRKRERKKISMMAANMGLGEGGVLAIKTVLKSRGNFQRVNLNLQF